MKKLEKAIGADKVLCGDPVVSIDQVSLIVFFLFFFVENSGKLYCLETVHILKTSVSLHLQTLEFFFMTLRYQNQVFISEFHVCLASMKLVKITWF